MSLQFTFQPITPKIHNRGILCCICGEYRFEKNITVQVKDDCGELGCVCLDCVSMGPEKAGFLAYEEACNLRRQSDRQFYLAAEVAHLPQAQWPDYKALLKAKHAKDRK